MEEAALYPTKSAALRPNRGIGPDRVGPARLDGIPTREIFEGLGQLHQLVFVTDTHGRIVWLSDALGVICGGVEDLVGSRVGELFSRHLEREYAGATPRVDPPISISKQLEALRAELRRHEHASNFQLDLGHRGGSPVRLDVSAFRVDDEDGDKLNVAIVHPISTREDDLELRTTVDLLGAVLDALPNGAIAIDRSGFVAYANPGVEALLQRKPDELVGQPVAMLLPLAPDQQKFFYQQLISASRDDDAQPERCFEFNRDDGTTACVAISASPLRPQAGLSNGTVAYLRDITRELRDIAHEREERLRLERENAELDSYVHSVSHDLRSPLVSLLGFTRLLKQDYGRIFDENGAHFLDRVEQAGRTMQSLIHDLLELSRIGKSPDPRTLVDPRSVLLQIQAELKLRLDEKGIQLLMPPTPPLVLIDRTRLYQVFSNLIGNAVNHMGEPESPVVPEIEIEIGEDGDRHRLTVRDNGLGIELDAQQRIFDPFQTVRRSRSEGRSTGMGLAIVKKIAESHGGRVWVESEPGQGAAFHFTLTR